MTEPLSLKPGLSPDARPLPSGSVGSGVPCDRCGTFVQGTPEQLGTYRVCEACVPVLRKEIRLYPTWYVYVWGILLNVTFAGIFSAINWKRLGDKVRMRNAIIVTVLGVVASAALITFASSSRIGFFMNIAGTQVAAQALDAAYKRHKAEGGARANLLWPLVITVGVFVLIAIAFGVYLDATGQLDEEP
jgi:hypothetical protein